MADVTYSVEVQYLQSGNFNAPAAGLDKLQGQTNKWTESLLGGVSSFAGGFNSALDGLAGKVVGFGESAGLAIGGAMVTSLGFALKEGLDFAGYVEGQVNGVATTLALLGDVPMDQGIREASKSVEHLRQQAALLPGEFKDAMNAFQAILPVGINEGVATSRLENMAAHSVAVAAALGVPQRVAGHELAALLEGRARSSMPLVSKLGLHATEFNKLSSTDRFSKVESMFAKTDPAMAVYQNSWAGLTSTAKDNGRNVAKSFAEPLFYSLKGELGRALDWFGKNEGDVHAWAGRLGVALDCQFHRGLDFIREWYGPVTNFAQTLGTGLHSAFSRVEPYLARFEIVAKRFMNDPQALDKVGDVAKKYAELRAGGFAVEKGASLVSSIGSSAGGGNAGMVAMAEAAPFVAGALVLLGTAAYGVTSSLADSTSDYHTATSNAVADIVKTSGSVGAELLKHHDTFTTFAQQLGLVATYGVENTLESLDIQLKAVNAFASAVGTAADFLTFGAFKHLNKTDPEPYDRTVDYNPSAKWMNESSFSQDADRKVPKTVVNMHSGAIQLRVDGSGDPNRVAKLATDMMIEHMNKAVARGAGSNAMAQFGGRP